MKNKSSMDEYFVYWNDVDEEDVPVEREEIPISPDDDDDVRFICSRNSAGKNPKERIQSLQSSLKSAFDDYCKQYQDMETKLARSKTENEELVVRINKLEDELVKKKAENEELSERNNKLENQLHKAKVQLESKNSKLEEELQMAKVQLESSKKNLEKTRNKLEELCTTFTAVKEECDQVCREQEETGGDAPEPSKKRKYVFKIYEVNDCVNCPICLEPWTPGEHNVCSLSCGHFFGRSCITQWIKKGGTRGSSKCPLCSTKATLKEIRNHYVSQSYAGEEQI